MGMARAMLSAQRGVSWHLSVSDLGLLRTCPKCRSNRLALYEWECCEPHGGGHDGMHPVLWGSGTFYRCCDCRHEIGDTRERFRGQQRGNYTEKPRPGQNK